MATTTVYVDEKNQPVDLSVAVVNGVAQTRILRRVTTSGITRWWLWAVKGAAVTPAMLLQAAQDMNTAPPATGGDATPTPGTYIRVPSALPETGDLLAWDATQMRPYGLRRAALKGDPGTPGSNGQNGRDGRDGVDGTTPNFAMNGTVLSVYYDSPTNMTPLMNMANLKGETGKNGSDGKEGQAGTNGVDGNNGADGPSAYDLAVQDGFTGTLPEWLASLKGQQGETGDAGPRGNTGAAGKDGVDSTVPGPVGPRGAAFTTGVGDPTFPGREEDSYLNASTGTVAQYIGGGWHVIPGVNLRGPQGTQGQPGQSGTAATIESVSATTGPAASVTNTGTPTAARLNFVLPRGETGPAGTPGAAATIRVNSVTTTSAGTDATVTNNGTNTAAALDFTVPRGADGPTGSAATVRVGQVFTGQSGTAAAVLNSGTSSAAVLDFTLPKGDTGAAGANGTPGAAATVKVGTVTTTAASTSASVTNSGTDNAAVLDFAVPRGAEGPAGTAATIQVNNVTTGAAGTSASVTNTGSANAASLSFILPRGDKGEKGDTGATGPGFTQRGAWVSGTTYATGEVVSYNGSSYAARQSTASVNTQNPVAAGSTYWQTLASKGDTGPTGTTGSTGSPGPTGPSATVAVNSVKTGATPNVVNVGTSTNALLDFTLPASNPVSFAAVTTSETTISNAYAPLTTAGPVATITCGPSGILVITLSANASMNGRMSAKIEQGSTVVFAASDTFCLWSGGGPMQGSRTRTWTGLTPGTVYTVTALYNAPTLGNATFSQREITISTR